ncbi:hypothetical protein Efla_001344 [Eimeria flavescens]
MELKEVAAGVNCKAGDLCLKVNAIIAPIPFDSILGLPFFSKKRLIWSFAPSLFTGWRGGRRLELPIPEGEEKEKSEQINSRLWKDREGAREAHDLFVKKLRELSGKQAEALVRPTHKKYKNFKTAAARARVRSLAALARAHNEGRLQVFLWKMPVMTEDAQKQATQSAKAARCEPMADGGPASQPPETALDHGASSPYLVVPLALSFKFQEVFVPTFKKFEAVLKEERRNLPPAFPDMLVSYRDLFPDSLAPGPPVHRPHYTHNPRQDSAKGTHLQCRPRRQFKYEGGIAKASGERTYHAYLFAIRGALRAGEEGKKSFEGASSKLRAEADLLKVQKKNL